MDTTGWASATVAYLAKKLSDEVWVLISVWSKVQRFARHLADTTATPLSLDFYAPVFAAALYLWKTADHRKWTELIKDVKC